MTTEGAGRWREVSRIYGVALQCAPAERDAFLSAACGTDAELRREVESLLAEENGSLVIDRPAFAVTGVMPSQMPVQIGPQIGVHRIDALLGVGGPAFARAVIVRELRRGLAVAQPRTRC